MKKISVLMPAFSAGSTVAMAVDSMLWQQVPAGCHYEVMVLDDGSSDDTLAIVQRIVEQNRYAQVRVLPHEVNLGIVRSLNRLIEESDADYFVRMDADDIALPGRVVAQVTVLEAGFDLVGTFAYNFGSMHGERRYSLDPLEHKILAIIDQRSFCHPSIAFNRKVAQIGYREQAAEDYGLLTDLLVAGLSLTNVPRPYLMYRVHDQSMSSSSDAARFARLRQAVCTTRTGYLRRLLGMEADAAWACSNGIENQIFRRSTAEDLAALDRLRATVRSRLHVEVDFRRI